jgi:hypothetical protein
VPPLAPHRIGRATKRISRCRHSRKCFLLLLFKKEELSSDTQLVWRRTQKMDNLHWGRILGRHR